MIGQYQVTKSHRDSKESIYRKVSMIDTFPEAKVSIIDTFPLAVYSYYATDNIA